MKHNFWWLFLMLTEISIEQEKGDRQNTDKNSLSRKHLVIAGRILDKQIENVVIIEKRSNNNVPVC